MKDREKFKRFPKYEPPDISECTWGDGHIVYIPYTGNPRFSNMGFIWMELLDWVTDIRNINMRKKDSIEFNLGNLLIPYVADHDFFAVRQIIKIHLRDFKQAFMRPEMSEDLKIIIIALMEDDWYADEEEGVVDEENEDL
ncbi:MAG: hypothetical protein R3Y24_08175 [Eubacteriales bacterium]